MSSSIYFQAHLDGDSQEIEVSKIIDAFAPYVSKSDGFGFEVKYDEMNSSFIYLNVSDETCSGFSINKPCADKRLYMAIFKCLNWEISFITGVIVRNFTSQIKLL